MSGPAQDTTDLTNQLLAELRKPVCNAEKCIALLNSGADSTACDGSKNTVLMIALNHAKKDLVQAILEKGGDIDAKDMYGKTALMRSCRHFSYDQVALLLAHGADPDIQDDDGKTALMHTIICKRTNEALQLIAHGANLDLQSYGAKNTALMLAAAKSSHEHQQIINAIIERSPDFDLKNVHGQTALIIAEAYNVPKNVALIRIGHTKQAFRAAAARGTPKARKIIRPRPQH